MSKKQIQWKRIKTFIKYLPLITDTLSSLWEIIKTVITEENIKALEEIAKNDNNINEK